MPRPKAPKIVMRKIADLNMAEYNPRRLTEKQAEEIKKSLTKFGMPVPAVVNKHKERLDVIVGGHQRIRIMESMGATEVPTVEVNLPLEEEKELNIRLNKNTGEWDFEMLANCFDEASLLDYGFQDFELGMFDDTDYTPEYNPESANGEVTQEDIDSKKDALESRYDDASIVKTLEVICPQCGCEFKING
jgi:hypothetical protein